MKHQRKELILQIAMMDKKMHYQQAKAGVYQNNISKKTTDYALVIAGLLIPAVLIGWSIAKKKWPVTLLVRGLKLGVVSLIKPMLRVR